MSRKAKMIPDRENVSPANAHSRSSLDGGELTSVLHAASWNVIRLGRDPERR